MRAAFWAVEAAARAAAALTRAAVWTAGRVPSWVDRAVPWLVVLAAARWLWP